MNKYLIRGIISIILAIVLILISYQLMKNENNSYKFLMAFGVIAFGYGFITIVYSFFRSIDRNTILNFRNKRKNKN
ncbi:signal peptidase [Sphingobacterium sp. HJSM2_6]|uniref:signal peptidase n=1 Tax=Sphingobacterium sp. HJSM2_6 TaxID=3366264 RepID=UPI003BCD8BB8